MNEVTRIINAIEQGDSEAAEKLLPLVYDELRVLAAHKMAREKPGQTLQATALVHEAYIRLVGSEAQGWDNRGHFFTAAAEAMRRILIENARRKKRKKHGGEHRRVDLHEAELAIGEFSRDFVALDEALAKLRGKDETKFRLVTLHSLAGLTLQEAAEILGLSVRTAKRYWRYARAWLYNEISKGD